MATVFSSILPVRSYKIFVIYDPCRFDIPVITGSHQIGIHQKRWHDSLSSEFMLEFQERILSSLTPSVLE
jgi:hypothetical protein